MTFYRNRFQFIASRLFPGVDFFNSLHVFDQRIRCLFENIQITKRFEIVFNDIDDGGMYDNIIYKLPSLPVYFFLFFAHDLLLLYWKV